MSEQGLPFGGDIRHGDMLGRLEIKARDEEADQAAAAEQIAREYGAEGPVTAGHQIAEAELVEGET